MSILEYKNLKLKHFINNVVINFWSYENFASIEDIKRKYNPIDRFVKITSYKKYWVELKPNAIAKLVSKLFLFKEVFIFIYLFIIIIIKSDFF